MMVNIFALVIFAVVIIASVLIHYRIAKGGGLASLESEVAAQFSSRSHRLVMQGIKIDSAAYTWEKGEEQLKWIESLHQYADDYEYEVAKRAVNNNERTVLAYGGIRLVNRKAD